MIEIIDLNSPKAVGLRLTGKIEEVDMEKCIYAIKEKLQQSEPVAIYVELEAFTGISFEALFEDLRLGATHFKKFTRKAVVSNNPWIGRLANLADKFFPSHEVRAFPLAQKQEALDWVSQ